jgi:hypothetical protein
MRIIGEIPHPRFKITVFKMEHRLTLKMENGLYEQAYRFTLSDNLSGFEDVEKLLDDTFLEEVEARFQAMRAGTESLMRRRFPKAVEWDEEII